MKLSDELRQQLLESAAWGKAGIVLSEGTIDEERLPKGTSKARREDARLARVDDKKLKDKMEKEDERQHARDNKRRVADSQVDHTEYEDGEGAEGIQEAVHVCPLCISQLDEEIDEESLLEHLNVVVGLVDRLSQLQEGDEDIETVIDETIQELLFPEFEEE